MNNTYEKYATNWTDADMLKLGAKIIYLNKELFTNCHKNGNGVYEGSFLVAVKFLKDNMNCGLKSAKEVIDLYVSGDLPPYIKEERRKKLENLNKIAKNS
jgi:hypothetical protein